LKRKFITNLGLLVLLNLLIKPFWVFGIDRKVQNLVGAEEYGFYFSLLSFSLLMNILLDAGITNLNNRSISRNQGLLSTYFSHIVPLRFLFAFLYAIITFSLALLIGYSNDQLTLLIFLVINQFLASFILYLRSNISGLQLLRTDSFISVLDRSLMIIFCSLLIWGKFFDQTFHIEWFVFAQTLSYLLTALIALLVVLPKTERLRFCFNKSFTISILKQSYPYALLFLLMSLFNRADLVMLERMLSDGKEQAGIYVHSYRILDAGAMFAFLFAGLLLPLFSRMIKQKAKISELLRLSYTLLIIPAITISVISSVYSAPIIDLLYNEHLEYSSEIFSILIFSFVFISTTYIFGTLLTANGNLKKLNILAGITLILNIILNLLLIPDYKALGSAISNLVSQGFYATGLVLLSKNIFHLPLNYSLVLRIIIFSCLVIGTTITFNTFYSNKIAGLIMSFFLSLIFSWVLQILKPMYMYKILKNP
jgi:O-antigen/teichoic acid export membrane protein